MCMTPSVTMEVGVIISAVYVGGRVRACGLGFYFCKEPRETCEVYCVHLLP